VKEVYISLGGNIGDVKSNIRLAMEMLESLGAKDLKLSEIYETEPVDCKPGTSNFYNAVASLKWKYTSENLLNACKSIEKKLGRPENHEKNSDRPIDLDIVFFGDETLDLPYLTIPHKEAHKRSFVLKPLMDLSPDFMHPVLNKTVRQLLDKL
jgi:2-amino-4-hydroxy-6-hydroxymethyldihydropteridine diphosphokinase